VQQNWLWAAGDSPLAAAAGTSAVSFTSHQAGVLARNYVVAALNASVARQAEAHAALAALGANRATWRLFEQAEAAGSDGGGGGGAAGSGGGGAGGAAAGGGGAGGAGGGAAAARSGGGGGAGGGGGGGGPPPLLRLRSAATKLRALQRRIGGLAAHADWGAATELLHALRRDSEAVAGMARQVAAAAAAARCDGSARAEHGGDVAWYETPLGSAAALLGALGAAWGLCCRPRAGGKRRKFAID